MFENMENVEIVSSLHRKNKACGKIENRATHSFFIRVSGSIEYNFHDRILTVNEGDAAFIPKGSYYEYKTAPDKECIYTSINFQADFKDPKPCVYSLDNFVEADYISSHFTDLWKFGTQAEKYKCISLFYSLISYISGIENTSYQDKRKFKIIEPAVSYLKEHIYDCSLNTDRLQRLCGISGTYFRKIFISSFGMSPRNYIIFKRLSHAKSVLDSGDYDTIKEVALSVGYNDPLYFSKVFKKMYGTSPSDINK